MRFHPVASIFPMMMPEEFTSFKEDIRVNGQREPIWTFEGQIVDGRNRFIACFDLKVEPQYKEWTGSGSLVSFVFSMNLQRRHLSASQKSALAVEMLPWLEKESRERQRGGQGGKLLVPEMAQAKGRSRDQAAKIVNTAHTNISEAKKIKEMNPERFAEILSGDKTLCEVKREIEQAQVSQNIKLPPGKFRVIYANPPWPYGGKPAGSLPNNDGGAEKYYPAMSIGELCAMDVKSICDDNAVLFMWVPSPLLFKCARVIKSWGFHFKTGFVWTGSETAHSTSSGQAHSTGSGQAHNVGRYCSEQHEHILLCTRGSCLPDVPQLFPSVITLKNEDRSEKLELVREIIDTLYPHGKRLELFARKETENWETWGNRIAVASDAGIENVAGLHGTLAAHAL